MGGGDFVRLYFMGITGMWSLKFDFGSGVKVWHKVDILPHPMLHSTKPINTFKKRKK